MVSSCKPSVGPWLCTPADNCPKTCSTISLYLTKLYATVQCVFKPKGYNIGISGLGNRGVGWSGLGWGLGKGEGFRAGLLHMLVRAIGANSRTGLAAWMPWPSSPTLWHSPGPCYLFILGFNSNGD